jgi:hypothetical protein
MTANLSFLALLTDRLFFWYDYTLDAGAFCLPNPFQKSIGLLIGVVEYAVSKCSGEPDLLR